MFAHKLTISSRGRAALLALLAFPLACDRDATGPQRELQAPEASIVLPPRVVPTDFDASQYFGINVALAAQQQYGPTATVVTVSNHLYGWRAVVGGRQYSINMTRAVQDQFGSGYILGAVGLGIYDWRAVHWSALAGKVLPVMVIAGDSFYGDNNITAVAQGLNNLKSVLLTTRSWYQYRAGQTFRLLQPLVVFNQSPYSAAQWNGFSTSGGEVLWDFAWNAYAGAYPAHDLGSGGAALRVLLAPFTGNSATLFDGGFAQFTAIGSSIIKVFASAPPAVSSLTCSWGTNGDGLLYNPPCERATFWVAHELGYTFGLQDCDASGGPYDCYDSIMQPAFGGAASGPLPPATVLTPPQVTTLLASGFFF
jgi:hypothetical protein